MMKGKSENVYESLHSQGNGPIQHVETCPDFFFLDQILQKKKTN
jgi:hypothetical protein